MTVHFMKIDAIKTKRISVKDCSIFNVLDEFLSNFSDRSILAVTSKIISICEGRVLKTDGKKKIDLIKKEADLYLPPSKNLPEINLTIKDNILIPAAGIDESNGNGCYILWPKDPQKSANAVRKYLIDRFHIKYAGVIITDSKTSPLRWGTTGISLAHSGFSALNDYIGKLDLFSKLLRVTKANVADGLAASSVLAMGEGAESTPMAIISDVPFVKFQTKNPTKKELSELIIDIENDLYAPMLKSASWRKKIKL